GGDKAKTTLYKEKLDKLREVVGLADLGLLLKTFDETEEGSIKRTIWEENKTDVRETTTDTDTEDIEEDVQLGTESRLDSIQKKLAYIKGIPELTKDIKDNCKKRLNSLEEEIRKQVAEYETIDKRFKEIDENEEYLDDEATADTPLTGLEKLEIDLNYLLDLIPEVSETSATSLSGQPLTPAKKQFYTQNEKEVNNLRLALLKAKYIGTKIKTITSFEKDYIKNEVDNKVLSVVADDRSIDEERKNLRNQYLTESAKLEKLKTEIKHNEETGTDKEHITFEIEKFVEALKEALTLLNGITTAELTNETTITDQVKEITEKLAELKAEETKKSISAKIEEAGKNTNSGQIKTLLQGLTDLNETKNEPERKFPAINAADAGNGEDKVHSLYAGDLVFNLKTYENETVENEERIEFANLETAEQDKINEAKTPEAIERARNEIIENRQKIRQEEIALVQKISEVLAKKETAGSEEEWLSLLDEIKEYEIKEKIQNIREAKRKEAENIFIADFESTLRKSDRKGIDGWQCDRSQIETLTLADEGDGHLTSDKAPAEIAEGYLYYHDDTFWFTYETEPPEKNCRAIEKFIKIEKTEQKEKGVMEARVEAKNKEGIKEEEKIIFDHAVLDNVSAINAAQVLLTKIKETTSKITTATASQAQAAVDELNENYPVDENLNQRLNTLAKLHEKREEVLDTFFLGENEKELFTEGTVAAAQLDSVAKVEAAEKILELFQNLWSATVSEYPAMENVKSILVEIKPQNTFKSNYKSLKEFLVEPLSEERKVA
ncbi:18053_t:CDS:10, partial [Funneliformis geosporum]